MKTTVWLDRCTITGVGEIEYHAVKFSDYSIDDGIIVPEVEIDDPPTSTKMYKLTGQKILISLYKLFDKIDNDKKVDNPANLIAFWCIKHFHPYDMREMYNELPDMDEFWKEIEQKDSIQQDEQVNMSTLHPMEKLLRQHMQTRKVLISPREEFKVHKERLMRLGTFEAQMFLHDLKDLYFAVKTYHAIMAMNEDDNGPAEALAKDGRYSDGMESLSQDIIAGTKSFADCLHEFCFLCHPLNMELNYDVKKSEFIYAPVLNSVFDIAWFALYRIAISGTRSAVDDKLSFSTLQCRACGRTIVSTGRHQIYCKDRECQAFRKAKNKRDERKREKESSIAP
ncbi:MAG TPA: hypothetical protein VHO94_02235 [Oscillospiraceae bacterium]|nr:hypothetical protein [Oscillospiraceae bacterium]